MRLRTPLLGFDEATADLTKQCQNETICTKATSQGHK